MLFIKYAFILYGSLFKNYFSVFYKFKIHRKEYEIKLEKRKRKRESRNSIGIFPINSKSRFFPPKD